MIDRGRLKELKSQIGDEDFAEVATLFLEEMADSLAALAADGATPTAADFHSLRGSALNMGFTDFATACADAERKIAQGGAVDMVQLDWLFHESLAASGPDLPAAAA